MTDCSPVLRPAVVALPSSPLVSSSSSDADLSPLCSLLRRSLGCSCRLFLLGEATHGTEEFYRIRAEVSRRLVEEDGIDFVAVEGDWPDCYRVNRYIQQQPLPLSSLTSHPERDGSAEEALRDFHRFPQWMWRNEAVREYVEWCRTFNQTLTCSPSSSASSTPPSRLPVAFYGMDLYSLFTSADAVLTFLDGVDKAAAERCRSRLATLGQFRHEPQEYGVAVALGLLSSQQQQCTNILVELLKNGPQYMKDRGYVGMEDEV